MDCFWFIKILRMLLCRVSNLENRLNNQQRPFPGGTFGNSPTFQFQRWIDQCNHPVPKGGLKPRAIPQPPLRDWTTIAPVLPNVETLGYCRASFQDEENKFSWH